MSPFLGLRVPKPNSVFRRHRNRLALFRTGGDSGDYWRNYWSEGYRSSQLERGKRGDLDEFGSLIDKYVMHDGLVLDAGCGPGQYVAAFRARGQNVIGIDLDPEVVGFVKRELPELDVREGDIQHLQFESGSVGCYLSLGVIEHFEDGPESALVEARRLLRPNGVALISVPYLNPRRAAYLENLPECGPGNDGLQFHQYYFSENDLTAVLQGAGLRVVDHFPYAVEAFLRREHPIASRIWGITSGSMRAYLRQRCWGASLAQRLRYAHMLLLVCRPAEAARSREVRVLGRRSVR